MDMFRITMRNRVPQRARGIPNAVHIAVLRFRKTSNMAMTRIMPIRALIVTTFSILRVLVDSSFM